METKNQPYHIKLQKEQNSVEMWSTQRLPFEPKGWLKELHRDISNGVRNLESNQNAILHAVYSAPLSGIHARDFCDTENILFYNVGCGSFAHVAQHGIRFERSFSSITPPRPLMGNLHYHRYTMVDADAGFLHWQEGRKLAEWTNIEIASVTASTKPALIWYAFKSQPVTVYNRTVNALERFGLRLTVKIPTGKSVNIASFMKPLIDGIIANFHAHNGEYIEELSRRISIDLKQNTMAIAELLCRRDRALLGRHKLLWPYREGVQWNPADELCLAADIRVETHNRSNWSISGSLFEIEAID